MHQCGVMCSVVLAFTQIATNTTKRMKKRHKIWVVQVLPGGYPPTTATGNAMIEEIFTSRAAAVEFMASQRRGLPRLGSFLMRIPDELEYVSPLDYSDSSS